jgi:UDP-glucose 4-epimerase
MSTFLITGAAGFIGSAIAKRLISEGNRVVTIDNLSTGLKENIPEKVEFYQGDCGDSDIYEKLPNYKFDAIFHIAGQSSGEISFDDPISDLKSNTESTILLLQFALKKQCKRFIYASSMSVYGEQSKASNEKTICNPRSFYAVGKIASEHYLRLYEKDYGIKTTSLRMFNVYGPGQNLFNLRQGMVSIYMAQLINQNTIYVKGAADRFRDFIYIDDVVESFIRCLNNEDSYNEVINIGTGIKTSVRELIKSLTLISNKKVSVKYSGNTLGDIHGIFADNYKCKSLLRLNKFTSINEGLTKMWLWAKKPN